MMPCPTKIWWVVSCPIWTLIFDSWILCWLVPWAYLPGPLKSCWHLYFFWALSGDTRIIPPFSCIVSEVGGVYWIHCPTTHREDAFQEDTLAFLDLGSHTLLSMTLALWGGRFQKLFIWGPYSSILSLIPPLYLPVSLFPSVSPHPLPTESFKKYMPPAPPFKYIIFAFIFL